MFIKFYDKNKFINNTLCDKKLIHTSVINYMSQRQSNVVDVINESLLNEGLDVSINNDKAVVLYNKLVKEDIRIEGSTDSREDFVWLFDSDGKAIDFTQHVDLFKGVQLISNFLEQIYEINPDKISDVKISEFLKIYNTNEKLTVLDLYNHVSRLYKNEKDFFIRKTEVLTQTDVKSDEELINKAFKPFGEIGEQPFTLNGIAKKAMELDWEFVVNSAHVSVHLVPLCVNLVGYGAMLGTYIKLIHNRPIDSGLSEAQIKIQIMNKNRNLFLFAFFGAPLTLGLIKASSSSLKDIVTIKFPLSSELQLDNNNSISNNSLFMLISNLTKKIPNCLKLFFRLLLLSILVIKLLGFSVIEILNSTYYIKIYLYVSCSLVIIYQLSNLYLLHKFSKQNVQIPKVLPEFIINCLNEFNVISSSVESIKEFKKTYYKEISLYLLIIIIITLML